MASSEPGFAAHDAKSPGTGIGQTVVGARRRAGASRQRLGSGGLRAKRETAVENAKTALLAEAAERWPLVKQMGADGGDAGVQAIQTFISIYESATVDIGGEAYSVEVALVEDAKKLLARAHGKSSVGDKTRAVVPFLQGVLSLSTSEPSDRSVRRAWEMGGRRM